MMEKKTTAKTFYRLMPTLHDNVWGGERLRAYGKESDADRIGESWELSFVPGDEATADGLLLGEQFPRDTWGTNCRPFPFFPVLTKFIDAREKLSVQVHPSDAYALAHEGQYGKTEMWYVVDAEPGAGVYAGLREAVSPEVFRRAIADGTVEQYLAFHPVHPGDVIFIPSGTVHAILGGVMVYEIQQNSTLTYRLYDYHRRGKDGRERELHVEQAMAVASLTPYEMPTRDKKTDGRAGECIGKCKYFLTKEYCLHGETISLRVDDSSYLSLTVVRGTGSLSDGRDSAALHAGDSFFLPAGAGEVTVTGELTFLTVMTPGGTENERASIQNSDKERSRGKT